MNLKKIRTEKGITQETLANAIGVNPTAISNYEIGIREPNLEKLKNIASVLDCTVDELLEDEKENDRQ